MTRDDGQAVNLRAAAEAALRESREYQAQQQAEREAAQKRDRTRALLDGIAKLFGYSVRRGDGGKARDWTPEELEVANGRIVVDGLTFVMDDYRGGAVRLARNCPGCGREFLEQVSSKAALGHYLGTAVPYHDCPAEKAEAQRRRAEQRAAEFAALGRTPRERALEAYRRRRAEDEAAERQRLALEAAERRIVRRKRLNDLVLRLTDLLGPGWEIPTELAAEDPPDRLVVDGIAFTVDRAFYQGDQILVIVLRPCPECGEELASNPVTSLAELGAALQDHLDPEVWRPHPCMRALAPPQESEPGYEPLLPRSAVSED